MDKILYFSETDGISLERMVRIGKFDMRVNHFHNEYEIFFLIEGEREFFLNNRSYHVKGGNLILVDENVIHMTKAFETTDRGHDRIILYVDKEKMAEFDRMFPHLHIVSFFKENYGVYDLTPPQQEAFFRLYHDLTKELGNKKHCYKAMLEMRIVQYFIQFMREHPNRLPIHQGPSSSSNKYKTMYEIADYISEHFHEHLSLDSLASKFYVSKFYLSRTFKEVSGYGVNEYVNILRIQQAKKLLEETDLSISSIAHEIGYDSITYFEKVFKKYMVLSPLKYRKTLNIVTFTNEPTS